MITITSGSLDKLKADMKIMKTQSQEKLQMILKKYGKKKVHMDDLSVDDLKVYKQCQEIQAKFLVRSYLPVQVEGKLVNYILLNQFEKKLKKCEIIKVNFGLDDVLRIAYKTHSGRGILALDPLPSIFNNLYSIPTGEWTY